MIAEAECIILAATYAVEAAQEKLMQQTIERSLRGIVEAEQILAVRRKAHKELLKTVRDGEFDFVGANFNDNIRQGR